MASSDRLMKLMKEKGMTKYRLSKTAGCSATTVANWLGGTEISPSYLKKLSEIFDVSVDCLMGFGEMDGIKMENKHLDRFALMQSIKEVHETSDIEEVARLLSSGNWIAMCATREKPFRFSLGRLCFPAQKEELSMIDPLRDPQDMPAALTCPKCGGEMWAGETMFEVDGRMVCKDCFEAWFQAFYNTSPALFADALGCRAEKIGG